MSADTLVMADERALHQILVNLLQNAVKFTPEAGRVAVRTRRAIDAVHIFVEDSGIGIPKAALPKLGYPFEQVETNFARSYKGSGSASPSPARSPSSMAGACASAPRRAPARSSWCACPGPAAPRRPRRRRRRNSRREARAASRPLEPIRVIKPN